MKKSFSLLLALSLLFSPLAFLVSCANEDGQGGYYTFKDSLGKTVSLDKKPERVAVLFPSFADIWQTAGGVVSISVSDAVDSGFAPKDAVLVGIGSGHTGINTELLIASKPDFVIVTADYPEQIKALEYLNSVGIPAAAFRVESFSDYLGVLKIFTDILNTPENYKSYGVDIEKKISVIKTQNTDEEVHTALVLRVTKSSHKALSPETHFAAFTIDELGFENISGSSPLLGGDLLELAIKSDPCYIFVTFMGDESGAEAYADALFSTDGWSTLSAVKEGRVIYLPKKLFQQKPNKLWADSYEYIINERRAHPHAH